MISRCSIAKCAGDAPARQTLDYRPSLAIGPADIAPDATLFPAAGYARQPTPRAALAVRGAPRPSAAGEKPGGAAALCVPKRAALESGASPPHERGHSWTSSSPNRTWSGGIAPGPWRFGIGSWGECLPYHENTMSLNKNLRDKWGLPTVTFDCGWKIEVPTGFKKRCGIFSPAGLVEIDG